MLLNVRLSVHLSVYHIPLAQQQFIYGYSYYRTLIINHILKVEPLVSLIVRYPELAETAKKPSIKKHSLGGCTINMPHLYAKATGNAHLPSICFHCNF